jgi:hypothetical protein
MQTSIEWFIEHLLGNGLLRLTKEDHSLYSELRDKAKDMHKQEIIDAYGVGMNDGCSYMTDGKTEFENGEQYYQDTFKKD